MLPSGSTLASNFGMTIVLSSCGTESPLAPSLLEARAFMSEPVVVVVPVSLLAAG